MGSAVVVRSDLSSSEIPPPLSPLPAFVPQSTRRTGGWITGSGLKGGGGADTTHLPLSKKARIMKDPNEAMISSDELTEVNTTVIEDDSSPYRVFVGETGAEFFQRTLENTTKAEIYLEYLIFLRSMPNLQSTDLKKIQETVKRELNID